MDRNLMTLKILLPSSDFINEGKISRVTAETTIGSFGILPLRMDCVASLVPGILIYEKELVGEKFVAIDAGVLIKIGSSLVLSVRRAIAGRSLSQLYEAIEEEFKIISEQEKNIRQIMTKMESRFIQRMSLIRNE